MPKAPTARTLFINRMRREGRHSEWLRRYKEAKKDLEWKPASDKVMKEMGFVSSAIEREIYERFLKHGQHGIPEALEAVQDEKQTEELITIFGEYEFEDGDLPEDVAFVFHNLHRAKGEQHSWKVKPEDAPSSGSWNMLVWAANNQTKFFDKVLNEQLKSGRDKDDTTMKSTGESVEQIEKMLADLI
jgi:hypothetical protein